jgi:hypothetical protein
MTTDHSFIKIILDTLNIGDVLYTTEKGTHYIYLGTNHHQDAIKYQVNKNIKYIPFDTLTKAETVFSNGLPINRRWYRHYNRYELNKAPSNIYIIRSLLQKANSDLEKAG